MSDFDNHQLLHSNGTAGLTFLGEVSVVEVVELEMEIEVIELEIDIEVENV